MAMLKKVTKVSTVSHDDGSQGLDVRIWRKFEGSRDLRPGKGLRLTFTDAADLREQADALMADIEREVRKVERAAKKVAA